MQISLAILNLNYDDQNKKKGKNILLLQTPKHIALKISIQITISCIFSSFEFEHQLMALVRNAEIKVIETVFP